MSKDTIVALSSGALPAGIAVIRTSGPHAFDAAREMAGSLPPPRQARLRSLSRPRDGAPLDRALVLCFPGPASATGEDIVEFHCHGGRATVTAVIAALVEQDGCREAEPGEFTRRALANGILDLTAAEGLADLLEAQTELQRVIALRRSEGAVRRAVDAIRESILSLSAAAELAIDYADEEDGAALAISTDEVSSVAKQIRILLDQPAIEPLRNGVRVVVAGPPNAGKSSLINCLSESDRVIVTDIPGTTRDVIEIPLSIAGVPVVLVDTAGIRESDDVVERIGVERAHREIGSGDIVLWLGEAGEGPEGALDVCSKADLRNDAGPGLRFSAVSGQGRRELLDVILRRGRKILPAPDSEPLTVRERARLNDAAEALDRAMGSPALEIFAEEVNAARRALDEITGLAGIEQVLDSLFSRFCVGK